jgi:hypothetical protein
MVNKAMYRYWNRYFDILSSILCGKEIDKPPVPLLAQKMFLLSYNELLKNHPTYDSYFFSELFQESDIIKNADTDDHEFFKNLDDIPY